MIQINESSTMPIYQQVYNGLLNLIVLKVMPEHEKLPSVRELALELRINPNTIQKTYKALDQDGFIYSKPGKGNFVKDYQEVKELYQKNLNRVLKEAIETWLNFGISSQEIQSAVGEILKESSNVRD